MNTKVLTDIDLIREMLPTELFESSKDWREGSPAARVEWLIGMYISAKEEIDRLQDHLDIAIQWNHDRS